MLWDAKPLKYCSSHASDNGPYLMGDRLHAHILTALGGLVEGGVELCTENAHEHRL